MTTTPTPTIANRMNDRIQYRVQFIPIAASSTDACSTGARSAPKIRLTRKATVISRFRLNAARTA